MRATISYVAAATNRFGHAADISRSTVACGSSNIVTLWDTVCEVRLPGDEEFHQLRTLGR